MGHVVGRKVNLGGVYALQYLHRDITRQKTTLFGPVMSSVYAKDIIAAIRLRCRNNVTHVTASLIKKRPFLVNTATYSHGRLNVSFHNYCFVYSLPYIYV